MSTAKRERQRENRRQRLAALEAEARRQATRRRIKRIGTIAIIGALILVVIGFLQRNNEDEEFGDLEEPDITIPEVSDLSDTTTDAVSLDEGAVEVTDSTDPAAEQSTPAGCPEPDGSSGPRLDFDGPQPMCIDPETLHTAVFDTSEGTMRFQLNSAEAPMTVNNFVTLARWGYYDDTLLFRTDPSIDIIQGGSPHTNSASDPGPGYTIPDEPTFDVDPDTGQLRGPYRYGPGLLVMARSMGADSAGAQFFITTGPNASLLDSQGTYVVFGRLEDPGLEVAESIIGLHEPGGSLGGAPSRDVVVHSVTIEETPATN